MDARKSKKNANKKQVNTSFYRVNTAIRISTICTFAIACFIFSCVLNLQIYDIKITQVRQGKLEVMSKERAVEAAQHMHQAITNIRADILNLTDQATTQFVLDPSTTDIFLSTATDIKSNIPSAVYVRFINFDDVKLEPNATPPIRYSQLNMISRVEKRETVAPEAVKVNDIWQITFVAAAINTDNSMQVPGVFIITLGVDLFKQELTSLVNKYGSITFIQSFDEKSKHPIFYAGQESIANSTISPINKVVQSAIIADSPWQIEFKPSEALYALTKTDTTITYIILAAISLAAILIGSIVGNVIASSIIKRRPVPIASKRTGSKANKKTSAATKTSSEVLIDSMYKNTKIDDVTIRQEDQELLSLDDLDTADENTISNDDVLDITDTHTEKPGHDIPEDIFRAYDIRGVVDTQITESVVLRIGQALGSEALDHNEDTLIVARDARTHSPKLTEALIEGILSTGCHVLDIGIVPTPLMYFACEVLPETQSGVMVTASHNSKEYNGFKVVMNGTSRSDTDIKAIRTRIIENKLAQGIGEHKTVDIVSQYIDTIFADVALAGDIHIVIDAGNGVTGTIAPQLFEELGCKVTPLYCDLDGNFPNHDPDPTIEANLQDLIAKVKETKADLGIALDGDGDRLMVVTATGKIIWPDYLLMLFTKDVLSRSPGADIVFDVKSTRHLGGLITSYGGRPIMWKTGHSPMKAKMKETGALLGGEYSGHIFIKDRWYGFDDGMYAAARLVEILSLQDHNLDQLFGEFPQSISVPEIRIDVDDQRKFVIIEQLKTKGMFDEANTNKMDGIRADFAEGWGLIRASNTGPQITLRFEADNNSSLKRIKNIFARELTKIDDSLSTHWNTY